MDQDPIVFDETLTSFDFMLYRADMDAHSRSSMMFIETLEAVPDLDRLRAQVEHTTRGFPRLRQRVVAPLVPLTAPRWVVDPDFDLDYHFRRIALPAPGGFRQLLDLAAKLYSSPLDLGRPMWEATLVEGLDLPDARAAILWKFSHAITDGVGGMVLDGLIHDAAAEPGPRPYLPAPSPQDLSPLDLTRAALRGLPRSMVVGSVVKTRSLVGLAARTARHPVASSVAAAKTAADLRKLVGPPAAEASPLLKRRGLNRRFEAIDFDLGVLRAAAKSRGCSVNDAYLAGLAGALGRYHEELGLPVEAISLAMPISVRKEGAGAGGNQWSAVTLALPLSESDVERRMQIIREQVLTARTSATINPANLVAPLLAWVPQQLLAGVGSGSLGIDIQASNVPGHPTDRFVAGSRITRSVPIGPLPGVAMMATMVTLAGRCFVGVHYDTAAVREHDLFARCLAAGFSEVTGSEISTAYESSGRADAGDNANSAKRRSPSTKGSQK